MILLKKGFVLFILAGIVILANGCEEADDDNITYDIRTRWGYAQYYDEGNTYDTGSIVFSGDKNKGEYTGLDFYGNPFEGAYTVDGEKVYLSGDKIMSGEFADSRKIQGTWLLDNNAYPWEAWR